MPTIPLNLLAFLSEWLFFEWRKKESHAVSFVQKNGIFIPPEHMPWSGVLRQREFLFLHAAWLGSYCTCRSLLYQLRRLPQISSALRRGFREWIEKRGCRAPQ